MQICGDTEVSEMIYGRFRMCYSCFNYAPVFTISVVLYEGERSCGSYTSYYILFLFNAQVPSERSHSTVYNYAGYCPVLRVWEFRVQPGSTLIATSA